MPISADEHARRLTALRRSMDEQGLDAFLGYGPPEQPGTAIYLTGIVPIFVPVWCVVTKERCVLLASPIEWAQSGGGASGERVEIERTTDALGAIGALLGHAARVGVGNADALPAPVARKLGLYDSGGRYEPTAILDELRRVKSDEEIALVRAAARVLDAGTSAFEDAVAAGGLTEVELAQAVEHAMRGAGLERFDGPLVLGAGAATADVTMTPRARPIGDDEIVLIDNSCRVGGYCADIARGAMRGEPAPEQRRLLETVHHMYTECRDLLVPGADARRVHERAREIAEEAGYDYPFWTGHSIGCDVHEPPFIGATAEPVVLEAGMVVNVEPGVYVEGLGGIRIENTILVAADGPQELTHGDPILWPAP